MSKVKSVKVTSKVVKEFRSQARKAANAHVRQLDKQRFVLDPEKEWNAKYEAALIELVVRECASLAYDGPRGILDHFELEEIDE